MNLNKTMFARSDIYGMGTVISNTVSGKQAARALKAAEAEIVKLESQLSRFIAGSEISRINNSAGTCYERVSLKTCRLLSRAVDFSRLCPGCFDITVGPLTSLWRKSMDTSMPPDKSKILELLPLVDYTCLALEHDTGMVCLKNAGQSIDLGGIGKGFAADLILEVFKKYGISSAMTNFGGNVAVMGTKPDGAPWNIGICHPRRDDCLIGTVSVAHKSVVTSGDYQKYFIDRRGKRHHHILNPLTGYPAESGLISTTIVADSSADADALSTIMFIAGTAGGLRLLKLFPGTEAVLVDTDLKVCATSGLKGHFRACEGIEVDFLASED